MLFLATLLLSLLPGPARAAGDGEMVEVERTTSKGGWVTIVYKPKPAKLPELPKILKDFDDEINRTIAVRDKCAAKVRDMIRRNVASDIIKQDLKNECKQVEAEIRHMVEARDKTYHQAYQMIRDGHSNDKELVRAFADLVKFNPLKKWKCPVDSEYLTLCGEAPGVHGVTVDNLEVAGNGRRDVSAKAIREQTMPNFFNKDAWRNYTFTATLRF